jgi:hypothetical protein
MAWRAAQKNRRREKKYWQRRLGANADERPVLSD